MPAKTGYASAILGLALLGACATPATRFPVIEQADIAARTLEVQQASIDAVLARQTRANNIARPLLAANADLCHDRTRESFGLVLGNDRTIRDLVDGYSLKQVRALGYDASPRVLGVVAQSPAARAGLRAGAVPVQLGETEIDGNMATLLEALNTYKTERDKAETPDEREPLQVVFKQDGEEVEALLEPELMCDIPVSVAERDVINASANGRSVNLFRGLLTYFDDEEIAIVTAHEIGHVIGRHAPKQQRNALASGYVLWGIPVGIGAGLVDFFLASPLERWGGVETPPGRRGVTRLNNRVLGTRDFEREADYLAMYIAARAGADISNAEEVFVRFAEISPRSTYGENSHPVTAERILAIAAAREEIERRWQAGEELVPTDWPYPIREGKGTQQAFSRTDQ